MTHDDIRRVALYVEAVVAPLLPTDAALSVEGVEAGGSVTVVIRVAKPARGILIGKYGATVGALRELLRCYAGRRGFGCFVRIPDDQDVSVEASRVAT